MNYLPTINLWDAGIQAAIRSGQLRLQPGQWVKCGGGRPSRWCGVRPSGVLVAAHPEGDRGVSNDRFRQVLQYAKG